MHKKVISLFDVCINNLQLLTEVIREVQSAPPVLCFQVIWA